MDVTDVVVVVVVGVVVVVVVVVVVDIDSNHQKVAQNPLLTWKCALRRNGVHFFDIATSKSGPSRR